MSRFPHCCHSALVTIPLPTGVSQDQLVDSIRHAYDDLDDFELFDGKRDNPGCCPHRLERSASIVGGMVTPGCGWIDYQYWHFPSSDNVNYGSLASGNIMVFSRSSNFLCGCFPHFMRACCGFFCQCYGDGGKNLGHINALANAVKPQPLGPITLL